MLVCIRSAFLIHAYQKPDIIIICHLSTNGLPCEPYIANASLLEDVWHVTAVKSMRRRSALIHIPQSKRCYTEWRSVQVPQCRKHSLTTFTNRAVIHSVPSSFI